MQAATRHDAWPRLARTTVAMVAALGLVTSCSDSSDSDPVCTPLPQHVETVVAAAFEPAIELISDDSAAIPDVTMTVAPGQRQATIRYAGYTDAGTGITVNGSLELAMTVDGTTARMTIGGQLKLTGAQTRVLDWAVTAVLPWDPQEEDFAGEPTSITGSITADELVCGASQFADAFGIGDGPGSTKPGFVAVGMKGTIVYSGDGSSWGSPDVVTSDKSGTSEDLRGVDCSPAGRCVAVGDSGVVLRSDDGVSWTKGTSGVSTRLRAVAFGDGAWVAVGDGGQIVESSDGETFSTLTSGTTQDLRAVARGKSRWAAVGVGGAIVHATDLSTWSGPSTPPTKAALNGLATDSAGHWVAVGESGAVVLSSDGGATWSASPAGISHHLAGVAYGQGRFVAVGQGLMGWGGQPPVVYTSDDSGASWNQGTLPAKLMQLNPTRPLGDVATDGSGTWSLMGLGGDHLLSTDNGATFKVVALDQYGVYAITYRDRS